MMLAACCGACSSSSKSPVNDSQYQAAVVTGMRTSLVADLGNLVAASQRLQVAAPAPADRGWDAALDAAALEAMRSAWTDCRTAYEHIEGATAPIFPDIDASIDSRYEDFLAALPGGDQHLFDDTGVTGMHAIERILYANVEPARVSVYESMLQGYAPAAFPASAQEAADFKTRLVQKQIDDAKALQSGWQNAKTYDLGAAFQGLISLMNEQQEKVDKASTDQEESRYSQSTMADIRNNLAGSQRVYALFQPWIRSKSAAGDAGAPEDGPAIDDAIQAGFAALQAVYDGIAGDAIPQPPATWSSANPTSDDLATPFGMLYQGVHQAVDPERPGSIVAEMNAAAVLLGFPELADE
ncbi:MAG TPA: imelysin family protein [Polyangia bacterium]|nr:imelysin family protein [Polyangia bacterium]